MWAEAVSWYRCWARSGSSVKDAFPPQRNVPIPIVVGRWRHCTREEERRSRGVRRQTAVERLYAAQDAQCRARAASRLRRTEEPSARLRRRGRGHPRLQRWQAGAGNAVVGSREQNSTGEHLVALTLVAGTVGHVRIEAGCAITSVRSPGL